MHNTGAAAAVVEVMVVAAVAVTLVAAVVAAMLAVAFLAVVAVLVFQVVQAVVFRAAAVLRFHLHAQVVSDKGPALAVHALQHKDIPVLTVAGLA